MWMLKRDGDYVVPYLAEHGFGKRSQDLPTVYVANGSLYLISPTELRASGSFLGPKTVPLLIETPQEAIDIDTEWDFKMAESIAENRYD